MAGVLVPLVFVMGATALLLNAADGIPRWLIGDGPGVRRYASLEEVERKIGRRVLLPAYFPETLGWPPAVVRLHEGTAPAVALTFLSRDQPHERLFIYEAFGSNGLIPVELMPPAGVLWATDVSLSTQSGVLARVTGDDGQVWHDLTWQQGPTRIALRFKGPVQELLLIARSMAARRP